MLPNTSNITINSTGGNMINISCIPYRDSPSPVEESKASEIFRTVFMVLIVFFSIVGNALVLRGAIHRRNRPFVYYLVINLSIAEIVHVGVRQVIMGVQQLPPYIWVFGNFLCQFFISCVICARIVVSFTLATIAVFRAVVMIQPKRNRPSKKLAYSIMAISWIWGTCFAIPEGLNHKLFFFPDPCIPKRVLKLCFPVDVTPVFDCVYFIAFLLLPFAIMMASYGIVVYRIKQHIHFEGAREESNELMTSVTATREGSIRIEVRTARSLAAKRQSSPNNLNVLPVGQRLNLPNDKSKILKLEKDALNMLYILILVFIVPLLPWTIMYILWLAREPESMNWHYRKIFSWYLTLLLSLPSALHPFCYGIASKVINISFKNFRLPCNKAV